MVLEFIRLTLLRAWLTLNTGTASFVVQAHTIAGVTTSSVRIINSYGTSASTGVGKRDADILNVAIFR